MSGPRGAETGPTSGLSRRAVLLLGAGVVGAVAVAGTAGTLRTLGSATPNGAPGDVPPPPAPTGAPALSGPVIDVRDRGARGDGSTDDTAVIQRAVADAAGRRATVYFPAGTYSYRTTDSLRPAGGVTLAGAPGQSVLSLRPGGGSDYATVIRPQGDGVTLDGLVLERAEDFPCVFVGVPGVAGLTLSRMSFVGHQDRFTANYCHGVQLGIDNNGTTTGLRWTDSVVGTMSYGLFQDNASTATTSDVEVTGCRFVANADTDLEFNNPSGAMSGIRVSDCEFRDHGPGDFAIGVAYCSDVTITNNTVRSYPQEGIHVEDYSSRVSITGNRFAACGLVEYSHIQLISGCSDITVANNTFDASADGPGITVVWALAGGSGLSAGGRPVVPPSRVTVTGNAFTLPTGVRAVSFEGVSGGAVTGNELTGPGASPGAINVRPGRNAASVSGNRANGSPF